MSYVGLFYVICGQLRPRSASTFTQSDHSVPLTDSLDIIRDYICASWSVTLFEYGIKELFPYWALLPLAMQNNLRCHAHFQFSANQINWYRLLIQFYILNDKQRRSRSVGFWRSQLICIYTVCKDIVYLDSAGPELMFSMLSATTVL